MKTIKKALSFLLALCLILGLSAAFTVPAQALGTVINVTADDIDSDGFLTAVNMAISDALIAYEKDHIHRTVKVTPGNYTAYHDINLLSGVTVDLTGSTIKRTGDDNIVFVGDKSTATTGNTGYCAEDIKLIGGTFDCAGGAATGFKVAHVKNFTMEGVTVKNTRNAHLVEVAASDGIILKNCIFRDQVIDKDANRYEAVQLDVLAKAHFNNYRLEPLPVSNVTVTGCTFENVPRGIGSHTAILNAPFNNINITGNKFKKCSSVAIQGCNWKNVTIKGNNVSEAPRGIVLYSVNCAGSKNSAYGTFLPSVIAKQGEVKTNLPDQINDAGQNTKITISNNTLDLDNSKDPQAGYERMGIMISGAKITSVKKHGDQSGGLAKGTYAIKDVTISGNKITTGGHGIRTIYADNVKITKNTITRTAKAPSGNIYGIHATEGSKKIYIKTNTLNKNFQKGIMVNRNAAVKEISGNKVYSVKKRGISIETASCDKVIKNTVSGAGEYGINFTVKAKGKEVSGNTCKKCKKKKINISKDIKIKKVKNNK